MSPSKTLRWRAIDIAENRRRDYRPAIVNLDRICGEYMELVSVPSEEEWREHMVMRLLLAAEIAKDEGQ